MSRTIVIIALIFLHLPFTIGWYQLTVKELTIESDAYLAILILVLMISITCCYAYLLFRLFPLFRNYVKSKKLLFRGFIYFVLYVIATWMLDLPAYFLTTLITS